MSLFRFAERLIDSSVAKFWTKLSTLFSQKHALGSLGKVTPLFKQGGPFSF